MYCVELKFSDKKAEIQVATKHELLEALDQRILEALKNKATGETVVALFEARAWLTDPGQSHGSRIENT